MIRDLVCSLYSLCNVLSALKGKDFRVCFETLREFQRKVVLNPIAFPSLKLLIMQIFSPVIPKYPARFRCVLETKSLSCCMRSCRLHEKFNNSNNAEVFSIFSSSSLPLQIIHSLAFILVIFRRGGNRSNSRGESISTGDYHTYR